MRFAVGPPSVRSRLLLALLLVAVTAAAEVRFNRDVRPILSDKCFACHGPDEAKRPTDLRFDQEDAARKAIIPGDPDASALIQRVASDDASRRMPPAYLGHDKLSDKEIETLRQWVAEGAEWEGHWAFIAPERPAPPDAAWGRSPIDAFVARRLEAAGLAPQTQAAPETLLRRVSLDLTGLPPTPKELDAFLSDKEPGAYERAVDRLLESPRYGERMAFRWLEAARYADTNGYQNDEERYMWRWRDWVIDAFNRNQPFDEFTVEQLAGDLLPNPTREQLIATGFNRNHRGNGELGIVPAEYHVEYVVDRVETTSTVWLGLTFGCARCHDHKYDPLTQKEFYQLSAYFNNIPDRGRYFKYGNTPPVVKAPTAEQEARIDKLDARLAELREMLAAAAPEIEAGVAGWEPAADWRFDERLVVRHAEADLDGKHPVDLGDTADFGFWDGFTLEARIRPAAATGGIIGRMKHGLNSRGDKGYGLFLIDGKLHFRIESSDIDDRMRVETVETIPLNEWTHVAVTYDGSRLASGIRLYVNGERREPHVIIDHSNNDTTIDEPLRIGHGPKADAGFEGRIADARVYHRALSDEEVAVTATPRTVAEIAASAAEARSAAETRKLRWAWLEGPAPAKIREAWSEYRKLRIERDEVWAGIPTVMTMAEREDVRPAHVLIRGQYDAPGEEVVRATPAVLPAPASGRAKDRLELARWIVSRDNPLTARVTVNRFWQMLFGTGIVKTVEDFGSQGEWPTHPELLDWLAVEFMDSGWDVKALLKTIVTSSTYRQASRTTAEALEADPDNRLFSRGPRLRLPAESIRDQALYVAGLLHEELGGPSGKPYQPDGLWQERSNWGAYQHDRGEDLYRRSLYTFWKRTIAPPDMAAFDAALRETCIVRETRTNTPLQALNLMNDVTYVEAARALAERMVHEGGEEPAERLAYGFRLTTARDPEAQERDVLLRAFRRALDRYRTESADALRLLEAGERPPDPSIEPVEYAAYATAANLMLNLDEVITKE